MNRYLDIRRVRQEMSDAVGHDVRALVAAINKDRSLVAERIIDPGTEAEQCDVHETADSNLLQQQSLIQQ